MMLISFLFALTIIAKSQNEFYRGIWYYAIPSNPLNFAGQIAAVATSGLNPKGVLIAINWSAIQVYEPTYDKTVTGYHDDDPDAKYNWSNFDSYMSTIANTSINNKKLWIGFMLFSGPSSPIGEHPNTDPVCSTTGDIAYLDHPNWLYNKKGVGRFSTGSSEYYPDYLGVGNGQLYNGKSYYEIFWMQTVKDVIHHISQASYRDQVLFIQSCEGKTGDLAPYGGDPAFCDPLYTIKDADWAAKVGGWWTQENDEINNTIYHDNDHTNYDLPNIHLMVNTGLTDKLWGYKGNKDGYDYDYDSNLQGDPLSSFGNNSLFKNVNDLEDAHPTYIPIWRKATNMAHWYQQNFETKFKTDFDALKLSHPNDLIRDELDLPDDPNQVNDPAILFAIIASALHSGLDMLMVKEAQVISQNIPVFSFFNRHVNSNPLTNSYPTSAFCVLRQGLYAEAPAFSSSPYNCNTYALNTSLNYRFSTSGVGGICNNTQGLYRTNCIGTNSSIIGQGASYPGDGCVAQGGPFRQYINASKYDVGWYIFPSNYQLNLDVVASDLSETTRTLPWWNQQVSSTPPLTQGRFCRDLGTTTNYKKLHFDVSNITVYPTTCVTMVVYFLLPTCSNWSWKLRYKYHTNSTTTDFLTETVNASNATGTGGKWGSYTTTITGPVFVGDVDNSDFTIENASTCNPNVRIKFSTIEFYVCPTN